EAAAAQPERRVDDRRRPRAEAAVLDQRARAEVPRAGAAIEALRVLPGDACGDHAVDRSGDPLAGRVELRELRARQRELDVERQPVVQSVIERHLDTVAAARPARLGIAGI